MQINRKNIFKRYKWLNEKKRHFIISADYDGLICASFLNHYLDWNLSGFYDFNSIWLSKEAIDNKKDLAEIPDNIKNGLNIIPVYMIDEVISHALQHKPSDIKQLESTKITVSSDQLNKDEKNISH